MGVLPPSKSPLSAEVHPPLPSIHAGRAIEPSTTGSATPNVPAISSTAVVPPPGQAPWRRRVQSMALVENASGCVTLAVAGAFRDGAHVVYAIQVCTGPTESRVHRRYSAFGQLKKIALRLLTAGPCCHHRSCHLQPVLQHVFDEIEMDSYRVLNTEKVVRERIATLHFFLQRLHDALFKCPEPTRLLTAAHGCKVAKLIKSFLDMAPPPSWEESCHRQDMSMLSASRRRVR
ncbi:hypothetical protein H310_12257 [Aphanomyces invadans]|uniref:PX domain-containing protein n=1 Tax=Aphanomyces invadans TaxID=157072 RepID=A0A024TIR0_9STRA|nr:hypothetical protein H310_12257 [Aphanomyces invadans]ETV93913.1 hypothetical protein H310_12257 [Aphanomyces invadans]|eukprot:XP_008877473.1 hypothetical protein H310_12257 [Aphanomyces invadans]